MRRWLVAPFAVIGFLAVLLLLPASRWVVLNQWDAVAGRWQYMGSDLGLTSPPHVAPVDRGLETGDGSLDETGRFLALLTPTQHSRKSADDDARYEELHAIAQRENRAPYWAAVVRVLSLYGMIRTPELGRISIDKTVMSRRRALLLSACRAGMRSEPNNAYFHLLAAGALENQGDGPAAQQAFFAASRLPRYEDYAEFEPELRNEYFRARHGERGQHVRAWTLAETLLQHLTVIQSVSRHFASTGDPELRLATVRVARLLMSQDDSLVGLIVGRTMFRRAVAPTQGPDPVGEPAADQVLAWARRFASDRAVQQEVVGVAEAHNALGKGTQTWPPSEDEIGVVFNLRPALSGWALLSLLLLPLGILVIAFKRRSERYRAAAPFLVWVAAFSLEPAFGAAAEAAPTCGLLVLLAAVALRSNLRRVAHVLGILGAVWAFLIAPPTAIVAALFLVASLTERRMQRVPAWVTAVVTVFACGVSAAIWTMIAIRQGAGNGIVFGGLAAIGALSSIPARDSVRWAPIVGIASLLLGANYAGQASLDLLADRRLAAVNRELLNEAERIRKETGAFAETGRERL